MPNRRTGNFDVVLQAGLRAVSSFLSVHHREERYTHSMRMNLPLRPASYVGRWTTDPTLGIGVGGRRRRRRGPRPARGLLEVQIGSPLLLVPRRPADSRVTIEYPVLAHFTAAPGSGPAPANAHFRLHATLDVEQIVQDGESVLEVPLGENDVDLAYLPAPGVPIRRGEPEKILQMVKSVLRRGLEPINMVVEAGGGGDFAIHHWRFKMFYGGEVPAAAILLNLRDRVPTTADRNRVSEVFVTDKQGMAIALGREFITETLTRMANEQLGALQFAFDIDALPTPPPPTLCDMRFNVEPEGVRLELLDSRVRVEIGGQVRPAVRDSHPGLRIARRHCQNIFKAFGFTIVQEFTLGFDGFGRLLLRAHGGTSISTSMRILDRLLEAFSGRVHGAIAAPLAQIETAASAGLQEMLLDVEGLVRDGLQLPGISIRWTDVDVDTEGVVLKASPRFPHGVSEPVVRFTTRWLPGADSGGALELDAFSTWIPGGRISSYKWRGAGWAEAEVDRSEEHQFISRVEIPAREGGVAGWPPSRWCLEVSGYQPDLRGVLQEVSGNTCAFASLEPPGIGRADFRQLKLAVVSTTGKLAGLYSPWRTAKARERGSATYMLVHFTGSRVNTSLQIVLDALETREARKITVLPVVALADGRLPTRTLIRKFPVCAWAWDKKLDWRRRFRPRGGETTLLLGPGGDLLWRRSGPADQQTLVAALDRYLQPVKSKPAWRHPKGGVRHGMQAPDFLFDYSGGRKVPLRRFRGRAVRLVFWTTWAEGSLKELKRLDALARRTDPRKLLILAVNDGEPAGKAAAYLRRNGISLRLVADPEEKISKLYDVKDWPTTFTLDPKGRVTGISHGPA